MSDYFEDAIQLDDINEARILFGPRDKNLKLLRERFQCDIYTRQGMLRVRGTHEEDVRHAYQVLKHLLQKIKKHGSLRNRDLEDMIQSAEGNVVGKSQPDQIKQTTKTVLGSNKVQAQARTGGQERYIDAMEKNDIVFVVGPAGTGKTYLAVAKAVQELRDGTFNRLVLVRPAVEAGEKLGFLPGDIQAKVNPYLAPLFDCLHDFMDFEQVQRMIESHIIEIIPLAFMRGRTLNDAFVIMDEAQNTTIEQMKMFLTRMGNKAKVVITGDVTQIDLPHNSVSGLVHASSILRNMKNLAFVTLEAEDIVRHPLVRDIITAYDLAEKNPFSRSKTGFTQKKLDASDDIVREI